MDVVADLGRLDEHKKNREIFKGKAQIGLPLQMAEESDGTGGTLRHQLGGVH